MAFWDPALNGTIKWIDGNAVNLESDHSYDIFSCSWHHLEKTLSCIICHLNWKNNVKLHWVPTFRLKPLVWSYAVYVWPSGVFRPSCSSDLIPLPTVPADTDHCCTKSKLNWANQCQSSLPYKAPSCLNITATFNFHLPGGGKWR